MVAQQMIRDAGFPRSPLARLLIAGLLTAVVDGLWACVLTLLYGRPVLSVWQGVAATAFGPRMLDGGVASAALGGTMHAGVAFTWSAIFLLLVLRSRWQRISSTCWISWSRPNTGGTLSWRASRC